MSTDADITSLPYFTQLPSIFFTSAYGRVVSVSGATLLLSKETFSRYADNIQAYREMMPANGKLIPKGGRTVTAYERMIFPYKEVEQIIIPITPLAGVTVSQYDDIVSLPDERFKSYDETMSVYGKIATAYFFEALYMYM